MDKKICKYCHEEIVFDKFKQSQIRHTECARGYNKEYNKEYLKENPTTKYEKSVKKSQQQQDTSKVWLYPNCRRTP